MSTSSDARFPAVTLILDTLWVDWQQHVDQNGIDFPAILAAFGHSSSEEVRIKSAWGLWNGGAEVRLGDVCFSLDAPNCAKVLAAIEMCRVGVNQGIRLTPEDALDLAAHKLRG